MSIRIGIIGCGAIAHEHARALSTLDAAELFAYADINEASAKSMLSSYGGAFATGSAETLIADDRIDVVYICTWHDSHAPLVARVAESGKSVVLEKPIAITAADALSICDTVERSGITLMTAFKLRFYPAVQKARAFIGTPVLSIGQILDARWPDEYWAQQAVVGGGNVFSQGPHAMDLLYYFNESEPVSIYAHGGALTHEGEQLDNIVATVRFANGSVASLAIGDSGATPFLSKFSFQFTDGVRTVHLHDRLKSATLFDGTVAHTHRDDEELGMIEENRAFIRALCGEIDPPTSHLDGLRATAMVLAAERSIRTCEPQTIEIV